MMQVRPVEFQESFARVPVEQARQQHVLQREPDLGQDQVARTAADERLLELSRPVQVAEPDAKSAVVDPERSQNPEQRPQNDGRDRQSDESPDRERRPTNDSQGTRIDVIA